MKYLNSYFAKLISSSLVVTALVGLAVQSNSNRRPAAEDVYELHIQSVTLDSASRVTAFDRFSIRATFNDKHLVELLKDNPLSIARGEVRNIDQKIQIKPEWIKNDALSFKVELVKQGIFESILVRCGIVSKNISEYSRTYQCALPTEQKPFLTYTLGKKEQSNISLSQNSN